MRDSYTAAWLLRLRSWLLLAALAVVLTPSPASADLITIDFDSLPGMPNSPGLIVPLGSRLSNQFQPTTGAVFSSAVGYVAVVDLVTGFGPNHAISNPNGIGGVNASNQLSYGTPTIVTFFDPGNPLIPAVTDFVQIRGDQIPLAGATATLEAFDVFGSTLGSVTANDVAGGLTLAFSAPGIHSIRISQNSAGFGVDGTIALDNLTFNAVSSVPEPGTLTLFGIGTIGLLVYGWRRRKRA